jgi:hypothetical protein
MNVVERPEFRRLLRLCSRASEIQDKDIPHRSKLTKTIIELYQVEMERIKEELKVRRHIN